LEVSIDRDVREELRQTGYLLIKPDDRPLPDYLLAANMPECVSFQVLPVQVENKLVAVIVLGHKHSPSLDQDDVSLALSYPDCIAVALANAMWEDRLYHQAHYDFLTGLTPPRIAINVSAVQLRSGDLYDDVLKMLHRFELQGAALEVEITESLLVHDIDSAVDVLGKLRAIGVKTSIDDYGTGYSYEIQGYYFSKPLQAETFCRMLLTRSADRPSAAAAE
jgi:predicted signal transduction protein with EAL and GGDEF domain